MDKKKKKNKFMQLLYYIFILFIIVYIIGETGYYENTLNNKTMMTNEAIKEFEKDVLEGKQIDVKKYIEKDTKDYSNVFTKSGENLNNGLVKFINGGFKKTLINIGGLFN